MLSAGGHAFPGCQLSREMVYLLTIKSVQGHHLKNFVCKRREKGYVCPIQTVVNMLFVIKLLSFLSLLLTVLHTVLMLIIYQYLF